jgi:hypothetical protein
MDDPLGAFVPHGEVTIAGRAAGPLAGASFAVKDIIDVAGTITGCGNPDWLASRAMRPPRSTRRRSRPCSTPVRCWSARP